MTPGPVPPAWRLVTKHQTGAAIATIIDFLVMIAGVELASVPVVAATAAGATTGATANFLLGRRWIFQASGAVPGQAFRYALVAAGSLGLNSVGEMLVIRVLPYVAARVVVAGVVGVGWNYPLHRRFVFRRPPADRA